MNISIEPSASPEIVEEFLPHTDDIQPLSLEQVALIEANLDLVDRTVGWMIGSGQSLVRSRDEITSDGLFGLCDAATRFDSDKGVPFIRFASSRVRGAIIDGDRDYYRQLSALGNGRYKDRGRLPVMLSWATFDHDEGTETIEDTIPDSDHTPEDVVMDDIGCDILVSRISKLSERQRQVIACRALGYTYPEIAEWFDVDQSRIYQIRKKVAEKLDDITRHDQA